MADVGRVRDLLAERPDLEAPLEALLAVDDETDTWTFDDVPVESGAFGELVDRDLVEKTGDEYQLADPEAVRHALMDEAASATPTGSKSVSIGAMLPQINIDVRATGLLVGTLVFVAMMRAFVASSVFRKDIVVLSGNDPYAYLVWVEEVVAAGGPLAGFAGDISHGGEPLLVATLSLITDLVGNAESAGAVLAVYPVVTAILTGALLYWTTLRLTADRRIAFAAVVVLATMPGHALRTALGFADHHAFDYLWLTVTAAALVELAGITDSDALGMPRTWFVALALGIGVGVQTLAWEGAPLMLVPIGVMLVARTLLDVRAARSPLLVNIPLLVGLAVGALISLYGHFSIGWHTTVVAATPILLTAGAAAVVLVAELIYRLDRSHWECAGLEAVMALAGFWLIWTRTPQLQTQLFEGFSMIFRSDNIVEARSLFNGDTLDFLLLFGFFLFAALPVLVWATRATLEDARWTVLCSYGWYFFFLSLFQVRFTGQLGIFLAVFAGVALVWLAAQVDLTDQPALLERTTEEEFAYWPPNRPDPSTIGAVLLLFALVGGLGLLQSAIKVQQVTTDDADYEVAAWLADYADRQGWETYDERYVFSRWGKNRMYNYIVTGNIRGYGFAQANYNKFITHTGPEDEISARGPLIVTEDRDLGRQTMHARLHKNLGSRADDVAGLGRFRAVYATPDGRRKAFVSVQGATVRGTAAPNTTVELSTEVDIPGTSFTYERRTRANATGRYSVTVAYPGTYDISTANGSVTVTVPESAVTNGTVVDTQ